MNFDKMDLKNRCSKCLKPLLIPNFAITFEGLKYHKSCFNNMTTNEDKQVGTITITRKQFLEMMTGIVEGSAKEFFDSYDKKEK